MSTIAVIGGTGPQGKGLGYRFAKSGHDVVLGSRQETRALEAADELAARLTADTAGSVSGAENTKAAEVADLVLLAVPYDGHDDLVASLAGPLAGKVVISCVNPLGFDKQGPFGLDLGPTSAAEQAQALLPGASVVGAFHHLSAVTLIGSADHLDHEDVLVCGDDTEAKNAVIELAATVTGRPGIDAGALRLARQLEPLTAVLISINKRYKTRAGVAISGMPEQEGH
jgi:NADPH-dependent F420 reductase